MKQQKTFIYGKHAVEEALRHRSDIVRKVFISDSFQSKTLLNLFEAKKITPKKMRDNKDGKVDNVSHQGIFAEIDTSELVTDYSSFISSSSISNDSCLVLLDEIQDPHNVGAIIRSAAGFGAAGILLPTHSQAPVTAAVIKVSAGMAFRIPLIQIGNVNNTLRDLKQRGFWIYGLSGEGSQKLSTEKFDTPTVFVLGNEGTGIREKTKEHCDIQLSIPIHPQCESLNVAASTAVVLYEWSKQHPNATVHS